MMSCLRRYLPAEYVTTIYVVVRWPGGFIAPRNGARLSGDFKCRLGRCLQAPPTVGESLCRPLDMYLSGSWPAATGYNSGLVLTTPCLRAVEVGSRRRLKNRTL